VLLLHGGGIDAARFSYKHDTRPLSRGPGLRIRLPGYGESDKPGVEPTLGFYAGSSVVFMYALGLKRAGLVSISMGGGAASGFALNQPQGIEKLVLVDTYGFGGEVPSGWLASLWVRTPFVSELTRALPRRSRRMGRWSLFNAVPIGG
jgi:pimeloyl-ACP methyl ester carboxylesterase